MNITHKLDLTRDIFTKSYSDKGTDKPNYLIVTFLNVLFLCMVNAGGYLFYK